MLSIRRFTWKPRAINSISEHRPITRQLNTNPVMLLCGEAWPISATITLEDKYRRSGILWSYSEWYSPRIRKLAKYGFDISLIEHEEKSVRRNMMLLLSAK